MIFDTHCHLDFADFDQDREAVLKCARAKGVARFMMCAGHGVDLSGESPLWAELNWSTSLGKGVHREVESEGS